jgi:hypothetical protein
MPERGHPRWAGVVPRFPRLSAIVWLAIAACGQGEGEPADAGLKPKVFKDAAFVPDAGFPPDGDDAGAALPDTGPHLDAALPDAEPIDDQDLDGIPNDEDPAPSRANSALFVDTFASVAREWLFTSAAMRVEPTASVLRVPDPEPFVREGWLGSRPQWDDVFIRAIIRMSRLGNSSDTGSGRIGVMTRIQQVSPDRYLLCGLDLKRNMAFLSEHNGGDAAGRDLTNGPINVASGEWVKINLSAIGSRIVCKVKDVELIANSALFSVGSAGFRTFDAAFEADWFEVYVY